jgi:hypothetical protein
MTAKVAIRVETIDDALQVPFQAVVERAGEHYCVRRDGAKVEARQVLVGSSNEKFVVIRDGLDVGDEVLLNPRSRLPLAPEEKPPPTAKKRDDKPRQDQPQHADAADALKRGSAAPGGARP